MDYECDVFDFNSEASARNVMFRECFPETAGQPAERLEHYEWKFRTFPASPSSYEYAARTGDGLIGYYSAIPYRYRVDGSTLVAGVVCDVMTASRAREQGVFTRLGEYALAEMKRQEVGLVTAYPIRAHTIPGHLRIGWRIVDRLPVYVKVVGTGSILRSKGLGPLSVLADAVGAAWHRTVHIAPTPPPYVVGVSTVEDLCNDPGYPAFLERWMCRVPNALVKDGAFLRWRLGAPGTEYTVLVARDIAGSLAAVAIGRQVPLADIPTLALLDIMVLEGHERAFDALDLVLVQRARECGAELVAAMVSRRWARTYRLGRMGWLRSPHVFSLIVKRLADTVTDDAVYDADRWHTMWVDSDDL